MIDTDAVRSQLVEAYPELTPHARILVTVGEILSWLDALDAARAEVDDYDRLMVALIATEAERDAARAERDKAQMAHAAEIAEHTVTITDLAKCDGQNARLRAERDAARAEERGR